MKSETSDPVKLSATLAKLPRVVVTQERAPDANTARSAGIAYEVRTARKVSEAFRIKGSVTSE